MKLYKKPVKIPLEMLWEIGRGEKIGYIGGFQLNPF